MYIYVYQPLSTDTNVKPRLPPHLALAVIGRFPRLHRGDLRPLVRNGALFIKDMDYIISYYDILYKDISY